MENKYYTPEIEEFHVGFECELYNSDLGVWGKYEIKHGNNLLEDLESDLVRVKCLSRKDIECFGFERGFSTFSKMLETPCEVYVNEEKDIILTHYPQLSKISVATKEVYKDKIVPKFGWDDKQVNLITIKNKTEFKRLLKQLEVL